MLQKTLIITFTLLLQLHATQTVNEAVSDFQKEDILFKQYASTSSGRKSLSETRYQLATNFLKDTKKIDITTAEFTKALLYSESAMKLNPSTAKYALTYATFLSLMGEVEEAQLMAEVILQNLIADNHKDTNARIVLTQVYLNLLQFYKAGQTLQEIILIEPVLMNKVSIMQSYVSSFSMADEFEESTSFLHTFILNHPSNYGAMITQIKLYEIQAKLEKSSIFIDIQNLKNQLQKIDAKFHKKLSPKIQLIITNILNKEQS